MSRAALAFGMISLLPLPLLALAATQGAVWAWIALGYLTLFTFAMDQLIATAASTAAADAEFPAADWLLLVLAAGHFALFGLVVVQIGGDKVEGLGHALPLFLATGLFIGQVSNSAAHELIHRAKRPLNRLGRWMFISMFFGHHASAHPKVHHRFVGSDLDPNSARMGESYYRFAVRAWRGSFIAGYRAERAMIGNSPKAWHPYAEYILGAVAMLLLARALAGWTGVAVLLGLAGYAQSQLLISDYVQHYGLRRQKSADGRLEPVTARHSWNAPHWFSGHLMLNAPRHSDHHAHPARAFPDLALPDAAAAPTLPYSLPVMSVLALLPPVWRRLMDARAADWNAVVARDRAA